MDVERRMKEGTVMVNRVEMGRCKERGHGGG